MLLDHCIVFITMWCYCIGDNAHFGVKIKEYIITLQRLANVWHQPGNGLALPIIMLALRKPHQREQT